MARLILMFKDRTLCEVHVGPKPVKIGRDPSNDIHIDNPAVSRFHAEVYRQGHPFFIEDKNSTNGIWVNDIKISWKEGIRDGDTITIGKHTLIFKAESGSNEKEKEKSLPDIDGTVKIGEK